MKYYAYHWPNSLIEIDGDNIILFDSKNHAEWSVYYGCASYDADLINEITKNSDGYFDFSKNFIDIGCRIGGYSRVLGKYFNHTYAFDGNKKSVAMTYTNCMMNNVLDKVDIFCAYLSDKSSAKVRYNGWCNQDDPNINVDVLVNNVKTEHDGDHLDESVYSVTTHTLDEYGFDNIGFIKIDVEGAELKVLKGAAGTILRSNLPPILFEELGSDFFKSVNVHDSFIKDLHDFIYSLGYTDIIPYKFDAGENYLALKK